MISSMTGFARAEGALGARRWTWELRSVNGRGLEIRFRLPPGLDSLEMDLRRAAGEAFSRGSLSANLAVEAVDGAAPLRINLAALEQCIRAVDAVRTRIDCEKPRAEGLLALRGVLEADDGAEDEGARASFAAQVVLTFRTALRSLKSSRDAEGAALSPVIAATIDEIETLTAAARGSSGATLAAIRGRIAEQLEELLAGAVPEERIAQEAALLAVKADIREELDRLNAHVAAARALLAADEPVGRRFDFLAQEFNREANTLASKAQDMALKRIGLDLKTAIDQLREQVQNLE
jgi:uncharacterized protein (TIGR00255 family)